MRQIVSRTVCRVGRVCCGSVQALPWVSAQDTALEFVSRAAARAFRALSLSPRTVQHTCVLHVCCTGPVCKYVPVSTARFEKSALHSGRGRRRWKGGGDGRGGLQHTICQDRQCRRLAAFIDRLSSRAYLKGIHSLAMPQVVRAL